MDATRGRGFGQGIEEALRHEGTGNEEFDRLLADAQDDESKPKMAAGKCKIDLTGVEIAQAALTDRERQALNLAPGEEAEERELPPGEWPVVEFRNGRRMLCAPLNFAVQNADGRDEATRTQVPLILAWAYVACTSRT